LPIRQLGEQDFGAALLGGVSQLLPAASFAVYRTGVLCAPQFFFSASLGVPDTTRECWRAYLSGPYLSDRTLAMQSPRLPAVSSMAQQICHITALEVPDEHRAKVYDPHGMVERLSVVESQGEGAWFALNFYRHQHQPAFSDAQIAEFECVAPALLALVHKHLALTGMNASVRPVAEKPPSSIALPAPRAAEAEGPVLRQRLRDLCRSLTDREVDVCVGVLQGLTFDGIATEMGLSVPTVKTYRNRAFARLGIHFRNELFARVFKPAH
jgi:DNA-binding CsgD family transcriptional regulator